MLIDGVSHGDSRGGCLALSSSSQVIEQVGRAVAFSSSQRAIWRCERDDSNIYDGDLASWLVRNSTACSYLEKSIDQ